MLPATLPAEITCPICDGNKCKVCDKTGAIKLKVDARVPIQRADIVKYIVENLSTISREISRMYNLTPQIGTSEIVDTEHGVYEVVQVSSVGGVCWIVWNTRELEPPMYYTDYQKLTKWKGGQSV
jgi:hypothetical protein